MKLSKLSLLTILIFIAFPGCNKCDESLRKGDIVQIPIQFYGFTLSEIENTTIYRIDNSNPGTMDTFFLKQILLANMARSTNEIITDRAPGNSNVNYGYYESYFNNCKLIFDWQSGKDTLSNIEIIKSQENIKGCHQNDPNVKIDKISFVHKGKIVTKNESINISK